MHSGLRACLCDLRLKIIYQVVKQAYEARLNERDDGENNSAQSHLGSNFAE